jgi:hypothetical protein
MHLGADEIHFQFFTSLFCSSRIAFVTFRKVSGLMVFLPFLNFRIAHFITALGYVFIWTSWMLWMRPLAA